jgi:hypothetical protein
MNEMAGDHKLPGALNDTDLGGSGFSHYIKAIGKWIFSWGPSARDSSKALLHLNTTTGALEGSTSSADVSGPSSATAGNVATLDATGKQLSDGGVAPADLVKKDGSVPFAGACIITSPDGTHKMRISMQDGSDQVYVQIWTGLAYEKGFWINTTEFILKTTLYVDGHIISEVGNMTFNELTDAPSETAGRCTVYAKSDGKLYYKTSAGAEKEIAIVT